MACSRSPVRSRLAPPDSFESPSSGDRACDAECGRMTNRDIESHRAAHLHDTRLEDTAVVGIDADFDATAVEHDHRIGLAAADERRDGHDGRGVCGPARYAIVVPDKSGAARSLASLQ